MTIARNETCVKNRFDFDIPGVEKVRHEEPERGQCLAADVCQQPPSGGKLLRKSVD